MNQLDALLRRQRILQESNSKGLSAGDRIEQWPTLTHLHHRRLGWHQDWQRPINARDTQDIQIKHEQQTARTSSGLSGGHWIEQLMSQPHDCAIKTRNDHNRHPESRTGGYRQCTH